MLHSRLLYKRQIYAYNVPLTDEWNGRERNGTSNKRHRIAVKSICLEKRFSNDLPLIWVLVKSLGYVVWVAKNNNNNEMAIRYVECLLWIKIQNAFYRNFERRGVKRETQNIVTNRPQSLRCFHSANCNVFALCVLFFIFSPLDSLFIHLFRFRSNCIGCPFLRYSLSLRWPRPSWLLDLVRLVIVIDDCNLGELNAQQSVRFVSKRKRWESEWDVGLCVVATRSCYQSAVSQKHTTNHIQIRMIAQVQPIAILIVIVILIHKKNSGIWAKDASFLPRSHISQDECVCNLHGAQIVSGDLVWPLLLHCWLFCVFTTIYEENNKNNERNKLWKSYLMNQ